MKFMFLVCMFYCVIDVDDEFFVWFVCVMDCFLFNYCFFDQGSIDYGLVDIELEEVLDEFVGCLVYDWICLGCVGLLVI